MLGDRSSNLNRVMINEIVNDYVEYLKVDLTKEMTKLKTLNAVIETVTSVTSETRKKSYTMLHISPVFDTIDDMLTRLEEFQNLMQMVQTSGLHSLDGTVPNILLYKDRLKNLCDRVDRLEIFLNRVEEDLNVVESQVDVAEADLGSSDGKLKNILKPLFFKKSDPVVRSPVYEAPEIFKTSDFFLPDENMSDS